MRPTGGASVATGRPAPRHPYRHIVVALAVTAGGILAAGGSALAYWTVNGSGPGTAVAAQVTDLTISAVTSPSPTAALYPGASGDVVMKIDNPNPFPVTITAVDLPPATSYATGYADATTTLPLPGCAASGATASQVAWSHAGAANPHVLAAPLTVGAGSSLVVTMTGDAVMGTASPAGCEGAYFVMPPLPSVVATSAAPGTPAGPTSDSWTS